MTDKTVRCLKIDRGFLIATCIALLIGLIWTAYLGNERANYWYGKYVEAVQK